MRTIGALRSGITLKSNLSVRAIGAPRSGITLKSNLKSVNLRRWRKLIPISD